MEDHRSAQISSLVESLLPWVRTRGGRVRHVMTSCTTEGAQTLCGSVFAVGEGNIFAWKGRTNAPAAKLRVCGNCSRVAEAILVAAAE